MRYFVLLSQVFLPISPICIIKYKTKSIRYSVKDEPLELDDASLQHLAKKKNKTCRLLEFDAAINIVADVKAFDGI